MIYLTDLEANAKRPEPTSPAAIVQVPTCTGETSWHGFEDIEDAIRFNRDGDRDSQMTRIGEWTWHRRNDDAPTTKNETIRPVAIDPDGTLRETDGTVIPPIPGLEAADVRGNSEPTAPLRTVQAWTRALVALRAVNAWLTRHTRDDEDDGTVYFEGLPRPEVGKLREKVRDALGRLPEAAPVPEAVSPGNIARVLEVAPSNLEWFATLIEQGVDISQGFSSISKGIFPLTLRAIAEAVRMGTVEARKVDQERAGEGEPVVIGYINYRGKASCRRILPRTIRFAASEWHPEPQWLLDAYDLDKQAERSFALNNVMAWNVPAVPPKVTP